MPPLAQRHDQGQRWPRHKDPERRPQREKLLQEHAYQVPVPATTSDTTAASSTGIGSQVAARNSAAQSVDEAERNTGPTCMPSLSVPTIVANAAQKFTHAVRNVATGAMLTSTPIGPPHRPKPPSEATRISAASNSAAMSKQLKELAEVKSKEPWNFEAGDAREWKDQEHSMFSARV